MQRLLLLVPTSTYRAAAFVEAAEKLDVQLTFASSQPNALCEHDVATLAAVDLSNPVAAAADMCRFAQQYPLDAVVAVDDQATRAMATIAAALSLPHNPVDAIYAALNKHVMRQRLAEAAVEQPDFRLVEVDEDAVRVAGSVDYPAVLKPLMMAASRGVVRVDSSEDFVREFDSICSIIAQPDAPDDAASRSAFLVEQYVPGWEVAVEGILTHGDLHVFAIFDKPDPLVGPYFPESIYVTPSRLPRRTQHRIVSLTRRALRAIGLVHGPIHAEIRGAAEHEWFIEVAPRSIGGYCSRALRFSGDLSLEDIILRHALDSGFEMPEREPLSSGVMMLSALKTGVFKGARGLEAARQVSGVEEIIISAHPEQDVRPLPDGFVYLGFIFARMDTPEAVETALRNAAGKLSLEIETTV